MVILARFLSHPNAKEFSMQFLVLDLLPLAAFVILIVLIAKTISNSTKIGTLDWQVKKLQALERQVGELSAYIEALKNQIDELGSPSTRKKEPVAAKIALPPPVSREQVPYASTPPVSEVFQPLQRTSSSATPSRTREEWEALIGGKLLNRIGALALIIGIGFFLKYAFDNNWISETLRVLIGAVIGIVCLAGGYRTNKRGFQIFAQGMVGAGIAILYLSVYAAFNFYHLLPQWVAFVFMSIVTIVALLNGLFYDSLAEGILGWAGGFLTPILLSTGQANEVGLFTYVALLDAGLLAMVVKKERWAIFEPLAFVGTWIMYLIWRSEYYTDADLWGTVFFATVFWVLFLVPDVLRSRKATAGERFKQIVPIFNAAFYFLAVYFLIDKDNHPWMGLATLAIGAVYLAIFLVQQRRGNLRNDVKIQHTLTAAALLVIATAIQFRDFDTVIFWSIEAAALVWCSTEWKEDYVQTAALVLFGCVVFKLLFFTESALAYSPIRDFVLVLNHRAVAFAFLAGSLGFGAFMVDRSVGVRNNQVSNVLHVAWSVILFLVASVETVDFFRFKMLDQPGEIQQRLVYFQIMTFGGVWITLSLPLAWVGLKKKLLPLVISALVYALLAIVFAAVRGIAFDPIDYYIPVFNIRTISLLLVTTGLALHAQFIQKSPDTFEIIKNLVSYVQIGTVLLIFVLLTGETRDFFQKDIASLAGQAGLVSTEVSRLSNLQQMSLSGVWLLYSAFLMAVGVWRKYRGMRVVAIALFGLTILKIFVYDLSFLETLYRIFSFVGLGLILLTVSYVYQKYKDVILGKT